jgi:TPR repeat protein
VKTAIAIALTTTLALGTAFAEDDYKGKCDGGDGQSCAMYAFTLDKAGRDADAFTAFDRACTLGYKAACQFVAGRLKEGKGTKKDPARAYQIYAQQCDVDSDAASCLFAGEMLEAGVGAAKDPVKAKSYKARGNALLKQMLAESAKQMRELARKDPKTYEKYERDCLASSRPDDWSACINATYLYDTTDKARTFKLLDQGCHVNPKMCGNLGVQLAQRGLDELANEFLSTRCDQGIGPACTSAGQQLMDSDPARAAALFEKACGLADDGGCTLLARLHPDAATKERAAKARANLEQEALAESAKICREGNRFACGTVVRLSKDKAEKASAQKIIDEALAKEHAEAQQELDIQTAAVPWVQRLAQIIEESRAQTDERIAGDRLSADEVAQLNAPTGLATPMSALGDTRIATPEDAEAGKAWRTRRKARLDEMRAVLQDVAPLLESIASPRDM